METLADYGFEIHYHPEKANKVADALSRKAYDTLAVMRTLLKQLLKEIEELELIIVHGRLASLEFQPIILNEIREAQESDEYLTKARKMDEETKKGDFTVSPDGTLKYKGRICVPETTDLRG